MSTDTTPTFWRDAELPFIEARRIEDGRQVHYGRHSHEFFSMGAVTSGQSTYLHERSRQTISAGTVVLMNPGEVHACNPIEDQPWSYVMLYVDADWLAGIQHSHDDGVGMGFQPIAATHTQSPELFAGLIDFYAQLIDPTVDALPKHEAAVAFFMLMQRALGNSTLELKKINPRVVRAAEYINEHFKGAVRLEAMCKAANLSEAYLIRAFEQQYHMTPHAYLINRRIQHAQTQLRYGASIIDIAHEAGFADQAHFQRVFKKHLAATPRQYKP
ncbi:AraC family transcriptional regulator [Pseudomonas sp. 10B1]|uniref:helix-turn-helix transcriptional regulator n=1 Tax=unclassified Pseudomonas TaxID=196821 RepID=UPI002AB3C8F3|nr:MULTISPECIES: AraC family transcriptional regulator [unclassified Pseudomonas]MDY7562874.1 AraC family transcriptional regulator [Pseudomonas sp. AB6]MEA9978742.1 AraC family transcriptional regulator [Pseudomonas sp. RTS4]MEA9994327.1 AraC family transcriptional regulator [Pseudomonas sp. AA4]MEB0088799.1 AraC family transcriptional regulator [Pseudomonas sp. RTI1]MEB0126581.1 AraC family transcriptional regulator [Pseudomonas sp. CCC1.2]